MVDSYAASQAEIIRAVKKDEQYLKKLRSDLNELFQRTFGIGRWMSAKSKLEIVADLLYFSLTTVAGKQTLGEEYVHMVQYDPKNKNIPSLFKRILNTLLFTLSPSLLVFTITRLERQLEGGRLPYPFYSFLPQNVDPMSVRMKLRRLLPLLHKLVQFLPQLHLLIFYFNGTFYHLANRLTNTKYLVLRKWLSTENSFKLYKLLGWISLIQFLLSIGFEGYNFYLSNKGQNLVKSATSTSSLSEINFPLNDRKQQCHLCLDRRKDSTATPCGHLFCWVCITEWMKNKRQCPLCREPFDMSRLSLLQNYD